MLLPLPGSAASKFGPAVFMSGSARLVHTCSLKNEESHHTTRLLRLGRFPHRRISRIPVITKVWPSS